MLKNYFLSFLFSITFFYANSQVEVFYPSIIGLDFVIDGDYLYFVDNSFEVRQADISNPLFLAPPSTLIFDTDEPGFIGGSVFSIGVSGNDLYFGVEMFLSHSHLYKLNLLDLDLDPVLAHENFSSYMLDIDFSGAWLYLTKVGWFGEYSGIGRLNTTAALPTTSSSFIVGEINAIEISGGSMYFSESTYSGVYSDGEIFFKNLFLDTPEVSKFTAVGVVQDLLFFEGLLYFTDSEGLKRINPALAVPTSELLISDDDYENQGKIQVKSYDTGEKYLFVKSANRILRVDLDHPTLSVKETKYNKSLVYPNPTNNFVVIDSPAHIERLIIFDMLGKKVLETYSLSQSTSISIDTSSLNSGIYNLQIKTELGVETKKLIKQ